MELEYLPLPGTLIDQLDTPCIVVDLDAAEQNIAKLQGWADDNGVAVRPHAKTTKSPYWAYKQIRAGAIGVCCAKVGEAEVMSEAGVPELMIPNQVIGRSKIARLMGVAAKSRVIVAVDSPENVAELSKAASEAGVELGVIIEVNVGMDRCGVEPGAAVDLAKAIVKAPGLRFDGVMGYEGHTVAARDFEERKTEAQRAANKLLSAANAIRESGTPVVIVSAAGTGTYNITGAIDGITELQCGSYIFMDGDYLEVFDDFKPALTVLATCISRAQPGRAVFDMGLKSVSVDRGLPLVVDCEGLELERLSEEHARTVVSGPADKIKVGQKVHFRPMHGDTTINLHEYYFGVRNGKLEAVIPIPGRGKFR